MSYFDNPQCPHCGYDFDSYEEYCDAQMEFGDDGTELLECPKCGKQFRVNTEDVEGLIE